MSLDIPDRMRFLITCSMDPDGFRKMQCPRCTVLFKIEVEPGEYSDPLALHLSRVLEDEDEDEDAKPALSCPYCAHSAPSQDFVDEEMERTVYSVARTQFIDPALDAMLSSITNSFKKISSSFLKVSVTETRPPRDMLPLSGPEVSDMRRTTLLCCNRVMKLDERWADHIFCPYCRTHLILT